MVDMPLVMLRMKIVESYSLEELVDIFNQILRKVQDERSDCPVNPAAAALYLYPEVFIKPRDLYITAMLHEICSEAPAEIGGLERVNAYLGNLHVSPLTRLW